MASAQALAGHGVRRAATDTRLAPAALAAWASAWVATSGWWGLLPSIAAAAGLGLGLACLGWLLVHRGGAHSPLASLAVGVTVACCAAVAGAGRVHALQAGPVDDLARAQASAHLVLRTTGDPLPRALPADAPAWQREQVRVRASVVEVSGAGLPAVTTDTPVVVLAPRSWQELRPGSVLAATARLRPPSRPGPVAAVVYVRGDPAVLRTDPDPFAWADPPRRALRAAVDGLPTAPAGLLPSLVTGDESLLSPAVREDLRVTGLAHLTAVSGANVAIVLAAVLGVARLVGVRSWALPAVGLLSVAGFVLLARPEPSVVRAAAMGVVTLLGLLGGARGRGVAPLAVSVVVLLLVDPWLARSTGFALSCLATGGIVVLARPWAARASAWMPRPLAVALAVPLAAQVACTPVLVGMAGQLSVSAVPANLLAVLAVPPATVLGIVVALVGVIAPPAAHAVAAAAMVPTGWIVLVAEHGADLPGSAVPWAWGVPAAVALSVLLVALTPVLLASRTLSLLVAAALVVALARPGPVRGWPPADWRLVACDVGQGDAVVLRAGPAEAVVVDTGPADEAVDRCLHDLGVTRVSAVLVSHFHADHAAGIAGVGRDREVGEVLVGVLDEPAEQSEAVAGWAGEHGVPLRRATAGDRGSVGAVTWTVLWPAGDSVPPGPNEASLVVRAEVEGLSVLLTGDIDPTSQQALAMLPDIDVDVLKVPHHGAPDQHPGFLAATTPALAVVSVGADNDYGHPDPSLLAGLSSAGARVVRTDVDGDVAVSTRGESAGELVVTTRGPLSPQ